MSDIRFNRWLHQSGTGGIYQDASGRLGIGTDNSTSILHLNSNATAEVKLTLQNNNGTTAIYGNNDDIIMDADKYRIRDINGSAEYIRIVSGGNIGIGTNNPATTLSVAGNVRVQNSTDVTQYLTINHQGVNFQNTGAGSSTSSSAHLLDDYEEGTWTPVFGGTTTAGTYTYADQVGSYTKIGNRVFVQCTLNSITQSSAGSGNIQITGLPFTSSSTSNDYSIGSNSLRRVALDSITRGLYCNTDPGTDVLALQQIRDGTTNIGIPIGNITPSTSSISASISYYVD